MSNFHLSLWFEILVRGVYDAGFEILVRGVYDAGPLYHGKAKKRFTQKHGEDFVPFIDKTKKINV